MRDEARPIASFLFVGPTGVGKTLLARKIAKELFSSKEAFIRLDMSEYSEKHSVSKLIGAPPGYVGYEDEGVLIEAILRNPHSVVLFDEIEKAHSDIYNLLLQILEDGTLTSSKGRRVSFKNAIIILTSNVGSERASSNPLGFGDHILPEHETNLELKKSFPPEFLNRLDETVVFKTLDINDAKKICVLLLDEISNRMNAKGIQLEFSSDCVEFIAKNGFNKTWGAREIRRTVIKYIENTLCDELLANKIKSGDKIVAKIEESSVQYENMNI
jgi:ATP-dependent Clp protease ATP-binding subunit ClpC